MKTIKLPAMLVIGAILSLAAAFFLAGSLRNVFADVTTENPALSGTFREYTFFATSTAQTNFATTTTATSTNIVSWINSDGVLDRGEFVIAGAKSVNLFFQRGDTTGQGNVGTTTFKVQVTNDDSTWYDYEQLARVTTSTTADGYYTRVASTTSGTSVTNTGAATSTTIYKMDALGFYAIRCIVVETTDGEHSCRASAIY